MAQGIIIMEDKWKSDLLALNLEIYVGLKSLIFENLDEFQMHSAIFSNIDIIILDNEINDQTGLVSIQNILKEFNINISMVCVNSINDSPKNKYVSNIKGFSIPPVLKTAAKILDISARDMVAAPTSNYTGISLNYFYKLPNVPCTVFRRYHLDDNDYAFEKAFTKGKEVDQNTYNKLVEEQVRRLFIPSAQRLKFVNFYTAHILRSIKSEIKKNKMIQMMRDSISSTLIEGGQFTEIQDIADLCISEIVEEVESIKNQKLQDYLNNMKENTDSYYVQSAQIISYVAFRILKGLNWLKMSQKSSFVSAAFFSNILFSEDEVILSQIRSSAEMDNLLKQNKISPYDQNKVLQHALDSAKILSGIDNALYNETTCNIIREHHGSKKGVGFKQDSESSLHSLSIIFNISQDYADKVLIDEIGSHDEIILELENMYKEKHRNKSLTYLDHLR